MYISYIYNLDSRKRAALNKEIVTSRNIKIHLDLDACLSLKKVKLDVDGYKNYNWMDALDLSGTCSTGHIDTAGLQNKSAVITRVRNT